MTKTRAYTSEFGNQMVTAEAISKIRCRDYNRQPTGQRFFSTHRVGQRRPVKHILKGNGFFAYIEGGSNDSASDGESLSHLLFKEALERLECTKLSLYVTTSGTQRHWMDVPIRIRKAEQEKIVPRSDAAPFRADVYMEFEDDTGLALKWENRLYLEICHTHAVDAKKQDELRELGLPVIEVEIPECFVYTISEDETSDAKEEHYRQRIKKILEGERGFLKGVILSNPSSNAYLQAEIRNQRREITSLKSEIAKQKELLAGSREQLQASAVETQRLSSRLQAAQDAAVGHASALAKQNQELDRVSQELSKIQSTALKLREQRDWLLASWILPIGLGLVLGLAWYLW
ncbi:hypothetical protein CQ393_03555 [Stenotrophomonas sp. MYb238]|uniref:hypothetical protein n=1 Tax=Stenotrophomonas sp. MYb238 TaxID=2040281 RepID=UPI00129167B0|nr:hypothetical protein [Stenotrophomonas sp. MYb238]MQP74970.1 hypothetical protein [Stenotrophomonas sp. MYb238]